MRGLCGGCILGLIGRGERGIGGWLRRSGLLVGLEGGIGVGMMGAWLAT